MTDLVTGAGGFAGRALVRRLLEDGRRVVAWGRFPDQELTRTLGEEGYREFDLLEALAAHASIVLSRAQLLEMVWGYDFAADGNVVDVFVGYLRRKTESEGEPRMIHTKRGIGFVLRPADTLHP